MSDFVQNLEWWLDQDKDLTPTALARRAGLDKTAVRQMIVLKRSPRIDTALKICGALGISLDQFFARDRDARRSALVRQLDHLTDDEIELLLSVAREAAARHYRDP
jgi:transcriptional regulator with XRE-family HTH domain